MGADQALEWELVTASGKIVTASPTKNVDLYWALSGGGGGTYGVVTALTVKAYSDGTVGGVRGGFVTEGISQDAYWNAIKFFHTLLPKLVNAGAHLTWIVQRTIFTLYEITIPEGTGEQIRTILAPFENHLKTNNIPYQLDYTTLTDYLSHVHHYLGPPPYGWDAHSAILEGGVMFNRSVFSTYNDEIVEMMRNISTATDFYFPMYAMDVSRKPKVPNAVLPEWREALVYFEVQQVWNFSLPFSEMAKQQTILTNEIMPPFQELGNGAYMNEADFMNPRWKEEFYGGNYKRLRTVKKKWDPKDLFYATTAVGSDVWEVAEDGRLCRT
jgi:hypothetical protein